MNIEGTFAQASRESRLVFIPYLMGYYPTQKRFIQCLKILNKYSDIIEIGIPEKEFSCDGSILKEAAIVAQKNDGTFRNIIKTLTILKSENQMSKPIFLVGSSKTFESLSDDSLLQGMVSANIAGAIIPDITECLYDRLSKIKKFILPGLLNPSFDDSQLKQLCNRATGFIYAANYNGKTGKRIPTTIKTLSSYFKRIQSKTELPVCSGFGISNSHDINLIKEHVDAIAIGTKISKLINNDKSLELVNLKSSLEEIKSSLYR